MSDVAQLDVVIGAKIQGVEQGLNKVQQDLAKTAVAASKVDSAFENTARSGNGATLALNKVSGASKGISIGFKDLSNDLSPLIDDFASLIQNAGPLGPILKTLTTSLIGGGGVGLALAAVSSLISVFGENLFGQRKQIEQTRIAVNEYAQSMQKAFEETGKQVEKVSLIVAALQSENTTLNQRKKLLDELNGISSTYFGNLKLEQGAVEGLAIAYQAYADNVFKVAKAKAAEDQIGKLSTKLVSVTDKINNLTTELSGVNRALTLSDASRGIDAIKKDFEAVNKILNQDVIELKDFSLLARTTGLSENKINEILSKRRGLRTDEAKLLAQIADLSKFVAKNDLSTIIGFEKPDKDKIEKELREAFGQEKLTFIPFPIKIDPIVDVSNLKTSGSLEIAFDVITEEMKKLMEEGFKFPANFFRLSSKDRKQIINNFKEIDAIVENGLGDVFERIAENVGNFKNPFAGVLEIIGQGLVQIGKAVILSSALLSKIKIALNAVLSGTGAGKGIAVGIGLIALGTLLKRLPKFAEGGIATKATAGIFGEAGPEAILPLDRLKDFIKPAEQQVILLDSVIRGSDLVLSINREQRKIGRKY